MSENRYVTLRHVAKVARENYMRYGTRTHFPDILRQLENTPSASPVPTPWNSIDRCLTAEEFQQQAYNANVMIHSVLDEKTPDFIDEHNLFPENKDVTAILHLPFIRASVHSHDYFEINYVYRGSCSQFFENEKRTFYTGSLVIIAPDSPHYVLADEDSLIVSLGIRTSTFNQTFWKLLDTNSMLSAFFQHALSQSASCNYITFTLQDTYIYEYLLQQIFGECNSNNEFSDSVSVNLVHIFFSKLLRQFGDTIQLWNMDKTAGFQNDFPMIMKYVQYHYADVSLSVLSEVFHYSPVHISRMFRQNLNQSFAHIIQNLKISHAKEYLEKSNHKIEEVAHLVGYDSPDHLSRVFKKYYGMTPSAFRQSL